MTDSVFDKDTEDKVPTGDKPEDKTTNGSVDDKLKGIVNDDGKQKYENVEKALDSVASSQAHIKKLEAEAADKVKELEELRGLAAKSTALEEIVNRLQTQTNQNTEKTTPNVGMSEEETIKALESIITKREAVKTAQENVINVDKVLKEKFGDKARETVAAKAAELGMSPAEMGQMSATNPKVVLSFFEIRSSNNINPTLPSNVTPPTTVNTDDVKRPEKSILSGIGATDKNRRELMRQIKESVYKKYDVEVIK